MSGTWVFSPSARLAVAHPALTVPRRSNACNNRLVYENRSIRRECVQYVSMEVVNLSFRLNENLSSVKIMAAAINRAPMRIT